MQVPAGEAEPAQGVPARRDAIRKPQPTAARSGASMAQSAWLLARQGSPVAKRCARNITRRVSEIGCSVISKTCRLLETREAWKAPRTVKTFSLTHIDRPPPRIPQSPSWPRIGAKRTTDPRFKGGRASARRPGRCGPWATANGAASPPAVGDRTQRGSPEGRSRADARPARRPDDAPCERKRCRARVRRRTRSWPPQVAWHRAAPS